MQRRKDPSFKIPLFCGIGVSNGFIIQLLYSGFQNILQKGEITRTDILCTSLLVSFIILSGLIVVKVLTDEKKVLEKSKISFHKYDI